MLISWFSWKKAKRTRGNFVFLSAALPAFSCGSSFHAPAGYRCRQAKTHRCQSFHGKHSFHNVPPCLSLIIFYQFPRQSRSSVRGHFLFSSIFSEISLSIKNVKTARADLSARAIYFLQSCYGTIFPRNSLYRFRCILISFFKSLKTGRKPFTVFP